MELKKIVRDNDGNLESSWAITGEQETFLLNYAINDLLKRGAITVIEEQFGDNADSILEQLDKEDLHQA